MECRDQRAVYDVCKNVSDVFPSDTRAVPLEEMETLLAPREEAEHTEGDWVRIRTGKYGGDVGQVEMISRNAEFLTVKLVPQVAKSKRKQAKRQRKEKRKRPLAYRLKYEEAKEFGKVTEKSDDGEFKFKGDKFDKSGFILLEVDYREALACRPTMDEIRPFVVDAAMEKMVTKHHNKKDKDDAKDGEQGQECTDLDMFKIAKLNPKHLSIPTYLRIGDNVKGTGEESGMITGRVKEMKGDSIVVIT